MALVNHLTLEIEKSDSPSRITLKSPQKGITPIKIAPTLSLVIYPYISGNNGRIKIRNVSIDVLKVGEP